MDDPPSSSSESDDLLTTVTHHLISLLHTHLPLIHHFKLKWSQIHTKLTHLHSLLSDSPPPSPSPLSSSLLSSLSFTLSSAQLLAHNCLHPDRLPLGKLRTQSDIHSLSASLDHHINDFLILVNTRDSAPGSLFVNLLTRVQIGSVQSKISAMERLLEVLHEDDKNVVVLVSHAVVPVLVRLLDSVEMREKAVAAIARVSVVDGGKEVVCSDGGLMMLNHLVRVVESGSVFAKEKACVVLIVLSFSKENARAIACRGGVSALLEVCHAGSLSSQAMAAGVLRNLARFDDIKENFVEENAVPVLIGLIASGIAMARENAVGCLSNLVVKDDALKVLVAREGGIESLRSYWDSTGVDACLEPGVELLRNLGSYHPTREVLIEEGFTTKLLPLLNCGVLALRIAASEAVYELGFCSKGRREMGEAGCVSVLVRMLDGKAIEEREVAAKALSRMLLCSNNRKVFKKEERGTVGSVQLLDPLISNLDKKWPVAVLASLVSSKKCKKQMVGAGACVYLQKLVELEVEGAKKLLESLGRGKLWGVFARP